MLNTSLTLYEMQLVTDAQVLITKNIIIQKVYELFGQLSEEYKKELSDKFPSGKNLISPKISRGENYLGLPYVMLDYPRQFGKKDVFAIRSFFWWGNFFSITLQLAGGYQQQFASSIEQAINKRYFTDWHMGSQKNKWEHHFENDNYIPVEEGMQPNFSQNPFLKLAKKIPLTKWDDANSFFIESFKLLVETLTTMPLSGEKDLLPGTPTIDFGL